MDIGNRLYRAEQVQALDRQAIEGHGIAGYELMQRAGRAAFRALRARWPETGALTVCCGGGNNGGDGYVIARLALEAGMAVQLIALKDPGELAGDAATAAADWRNAGGSLADPEQPLSGEVIVDALLGTGLDRAPAGAYARLIERINASGKKVLAVDVPSGLDADTGMPLKPAVRADVTTTFIGNKRGLYTGQAGHWCGQRLYFDLATPAAIHADIDADARLLAVADLRGWLPPRRPDTHKGDLGHVLVIGGDAGMAGAPVLAGQAALRTGSGLVSLATRAEHVGLAPSVQPELMAHGVETLDALDALIERADALALGPGLGQGEWSRSLWQRALIGDQPRVVDADALNLLAADDGPIACPGAVLTPHPGEAARLLEVSAAKVQSDRFAAARALAERFSAVVVLKGHGTLIAEPGGAVAVCPYGNPAMASAGMGDALTGIIASLLGQGCKPFDAACCGVLAHALAGDAAASGRRQIVAGDLIDRLADILPA
ncbi:NAD(P)H-hydrate dehydratase [Wenzhouxiangella limi]|uniref:Bifunctional NAD(P)H-hydrate repair enzyme n=1 Tax=Wenzhouxiangella limi TaxID=2707351 RepID=A0A845V708_9GAMM|nr:NAD(P)H-hydrate dehydratase [Wenzhouxiangella limi]NDY96936.1 NAD(P)H-hydrate dehydratase [Wenzhouxiangella limi]